MTHDIKSTEEMIETEFQEFQGGSKDNFFVFQLYLFDYFEN